MSRTRFAGRIVAVAFCCMLATLMPVAPPAWAAPESAPPEGVIAVRLAPLNQLLPDVEALVKPLSPKTTADQLRAMIGGALGDPKLEHLDQTRPIALVIFELPKGASDDLGPVAILPVKDDAYVKMFKEQGQVTEFNKENNLLLVTKQQAALDLAHKNLATLLAHYKQPVTNDVTVFIDVARLLARFNDEINEGLKQVVASVQQVGQPPMAARMLELEVRGLLSVARDIQNARLRIDVNKDSVDIRKTVQAKAGSGLAGVFTDGPNVAASPVLGYLPGKGAITGLFGTNEAGAKYLEAKIDDVLGQATSPTITAEQRAALKDLIARSLQLQKAVAYDMLYESPSTGSLGSVVVSEVTDPAAYMAILRDTQNLMKKTGMLEMYEQMGMKMEIEFQEKVRTHNDVAIHRMAQKMDMSATPMPAAMAPLMNMFTNMAYEIAVVGNYAVMDMGGKQIDAIIDAVKAGKPLAATKLQSQALLPNGGLYFDISLTRLVAWGLDRMAPMLGQTFDSPEGRKMIGDLRSAPVRPVMIAASADNGALEGRLVVPVEPIARIVDMMKKAITPPPMPPAAPAAQP